jgi:hypothetical protein
VLFAIPDGGATSLVRHAADGDFAGDTWHPSLEEAMAQARAEYGLAASAWVVLPADVSDLAAFARRQSLDR